MKHIYLFRGSKDESYPAFRDRILAAARALSGYSSLTSVKVTLTEESPPAISVIPFRKTMIGALSFTKENDEVIGSLTSLNGFSGTYAVSEVIPVSYRPDRPEGEKTPGVCLLTLFRKKAGLEYDEFLNRWFNGHTPLSLKIHPLWNYNRNQVTGLLTDRSEPFDGIVEEQFRTDADLLDPFRFFGNPAIVLWRMLQVFRDTKSFLEYKSIEPYFAREYWLVTGDR